MIRTATILSDATPAGLVFNAFEDTGSLTPALAKIALQTVRPDAIGLALEVAISAIWDTV